MSGVMSAPSRRIATLAGHLRGVAGDEDEALLLQLQAIPTMAMSSSSSVFEHVQQAPEDPILGVINQFVSTILFLSILLF